jgi:hypothetical protein
MGISEIEMWILHVWQLINVHQWNSMGDIHGTGEWLIELIGNE